MVKKLISFILCLSIFLVVSATALAYAPATPGETPMDVQIWYIDGNNVNLRCGPSTYYSSGGQVNRNDRCEPLYINGSSYFDDDHGGSYVWRYIHMVGGQEGGQCAGMNGYVVSSYVKTRWVTSLD